MADEPTNSSNPVDWSVAQNLTGGDESLLRELIELFPGESARHLQAIRAAVTQADDEALTRAAHTLKSSARLFGATALAERALQLETLARSSEFGEAANRVPDVEDEVRRVVEALEKGPAL
ncbi:MAG: Hpt domain-containing protein [Pseudomonadales bacterium]|jgi:HPt (histidine-containing phosphotransfer) domain-containing protein